MKNENQLIDEAAYKGFEFDYNRNVIYDHGQVIRLAPHEADVLQTLLTNRGRPTPMSTLIQRIYGVREPDTAAASIRVAMHTLRKKIKSTGLSIRVEPSIGYKIDASRMPELNRRLTDKILIALNLAQSTQETEVVRYLEEALSLAETRRSAASRLEAPVSFSASMAA